MVSWQQTRGYQGSPLGDTPLASDASSYPRRFGLAGSPGSRPIGAAAGC